MSPIVFEPLAKLMVNLAERLNVQIFVSSHSYLLVRWIDIFSRETAKFFYLERLEEGVRVREGRRYAEVVPDELDEFLLAYERLMDAADGEAES